MNAIADIRHLSPAHAPQLETRLDADLGIYWAYMNPTARACVSKEVLDDLRSVIDTLAMNDGWIFQNGSQHRVRYGVIASKTPRIFNLGGDLAFFRNAILKQDRDVLFRYGEECIDVLLPWHRNCDIEMTTMALVQGDALGGGFEGALSASVLIAEESARMGFPEVLFNLFPGMGAYSFLARKVGRRTAERLITGGAVHTARELYDLGVVDVITPDGTGEAAIYSYARNHAKQGNGRRGFERARNEFDPITRDEMMRVLSIWVDAALRLEERDLRLMERLVRAQQRCGVDAQQSSSSNVVQLQAGGGD